MVDHIPKMVDLARSKEETEQYPVPSFSDAPKYPYGLCISLCEDELKKLNIDYEDVGPGDMLHIHAMAIVTSVSCNKTQDNDDHCRIELQITHLAAPENEDEEDEEADEEKSAYKNLYK